MFFSKYRKREQPIGVSHSRQYLIETKRPRFLKLTILNSTKINPHNKKNPYFYGFFSNYNINFSDSIKT